MSDFDRSVRVDSIDVEWSGESFGSSEGCRAIARLSYQVNEDGTRRLDTLSSAGLFDIQGAVGAYRIEVAAEQVEDLREHLARFGLAFDSAVWNELQRNVYYR